MTESPAAFERLTVFRADSTNSGAGAATMRSDDGAMLTGARMPTLKLKGATNSKTAIGTARLENHDSQRLFPVAATRGKGV